MVDHIVSVGDDFELPAPVKASAAMTAAISDNPTLIAAAAAALSGLSTAAGSTDPDFFVRFADGQNFLKVTEGAGITSKITHIADSVPETALAPALRTKINSPLSDAHFVTLSDESGWRWAIMSSDNKVDLGRRNDGSLYGAYAPQVPPLTPIVQIGDSLTNGWGHFGTTGPEVALGRTATNLGIGSQTSDQIAARFGGAPALLTVSGNVIPASGPVSVTAWSTNMGQVTTDISTSFVGILAGVSGTLLVARTGGGATYTYTFTRTTAGIATPCPAGSPFQTGFGYRDALPFIWVGRNNSMTGAGPALILSNLASIVAYSKRSDRALIFSIPPWASQDENGTTARTNLNACNASIQAAFPTMFFDGAAYLRSIDVLASVGITATSQDITDIANGLTPTSFRNPGDPGHINGFAYQALNACVATIYAARGWTD